MSTSPNSSDTPATLAEIQQLRESIPAREKRSHKRRSPRPAKTETDRTLNRMQRWRKANSPKCRLTIPLAPHAAGIDRETLERTVRDCTRQGIQVALLRTGQLRLLRYDESIPESLSKAMTEFSRDIADELSRFHRCSCPNSHQAFLADQSCHVRCSSCERRLRLKKKKTI